MKGIKMKHFASENLLENIGQTITGAMIITMGVTAFAVALSLVFNGIR